MEKLEGGAENALCWFNGMKMNSDKCHLLISGHKHEVLIANIGAEQIIETNKLKLLGIEIDLSFTNQLNSVLGKVSRKLNALSRLCALLPFHRKRALLHAFIVSLFNYCP